MGKNDNKRCHSTFSSPKQDIMQKSGWNSHLPFMPSSAQSSGGNNPGNKRSKVIPVTVVVILEGSVQTLNSELRIPGFYTTTEGGRGGGSRRWSGRTLWWRWTWWTRRWGRGTGVVLEDWQDDEKKKEEVKEWHTPSIHFHIQTSESCCCCWHCGYKTEECFRLLETREVASSLKYFLMLYFTFWPNTQTLWHDISQNSNLNHECFALSSVRLLQLRFYEPMKRFHFSTFLSS